MIGWLAKLLKIKFKTLTLGFIALLVVIAPVFLAFPVEAEHLTQIEPNDLKRRKLFTFAECLEVGFDSDDDYSNLSDFFVPNLEEFDKDNRWEDGQGKPILDALWRGANEAVIVGLDRDKSNGVETCAAAVIAGMKVLGFSGNDSVITNEFVEQITGQRFG